MSKKQSLNYLYELIPKEQWVRVAIDLCERAIFWANLNGAKVDARSYGGLLALRRMAEHTIGRDEYRLAISESGVACPYRGYLGERKNADDLMVGWIVWFSMWTVWDSLPDPNGKPMFYINLLNNSNTKFCLGRFGQRCGVWKDKRLLNLLENNGVVING